MARILFSLFSNINWLGDSEIDPFYEGFINTLIDQGNTVMVIRTNEFLPLITSNTLSSHLNSNKIVKKVQDFNPDLIITANNHIPRVILDAIDKPILLWASDSPVWYSDKDYIRKNVERYKFLHHGWNHAHTKVCIEQFKCTLDQNFHMGHATAVKSKKLSIDSKITFVGTVGYPKNMVHYLKYSVDNKKLKDLKAFYLKIIKSPMDNDLKNFDQGLEIIDFFQTMTANNRIKSLDAISDLGLKVYGFPMNFFDVAPYSMDLAFCFDYDRIASLADTERVFNSAKIGVNLYNAHTCSGFSWRVPDIMASNACLISPHKEDLIKFNPYIKMPTFESPQECRELCQKLLKDEVWRKDVVASSHKAIEEHGRFEHMFKTIEGVVDIQLLKVRSNNSKGKLHLLKASDYIKLPYKPISYVSRKIKSSDKAKRFIIASLKVILRIIPTNFLRKVYHFILSIKNDLR